MQLKPEQVEAFDELELEPEVLSLRLLQVNIWGLFLMLRVLDPAWM